MSEKPTGSKPAPPASLLGRIDGICDRFEGTWKTGNQPRIEDYLGADTSDEGPLPRRQLLTELVIIDLEYRWRTAGQRKEAPAGPAGDIEANTPGSSPSDALPLRPSLEDYVSSYPELGPLEDLPEELIGHERRVVRRWGRPVAGVRDLTGVAAVEEFSGTERFFLERRIGAGGMGVVYQAFDRERQEVVAIKTMRNFEAGAIYRLKREFRSLADIVHENLVVLHELFSVGVWWFFTMEFVEGLEFLDYVRSGARRFEERPAANGTWDSASAGAAGREKNAFMVDTDPGSAGTREDFTAASKRAERGEAPPIEAPLSPDQLTRLRSGLRQIAEGVSALHQAGRLHRDIKPSNVLVTPTGRVVLLDFGLTTEFERVGLSTTTGNHIVGTVPYMSPEQAAGEQISPASDLYSMGVMLYEALTGRHPFVGQPLDVLAAKREKDPPAPREVVHGVPDDLDRLCVALLARDPRARPSLSEVLRRLGSVPAGQPSRPLSRPRPSRRTPFVGREQHLSTLLNAFGAMRCGRTVVVHVHGRPGIGKTALAKRFLEQVCGPDETVVLAGRCDERESVPFKALDSLVDALSHYLVKLPRLEADALMPRDTLALSEVFPVLRRVQAVARLRRRAFDGLSREELRQRAFDGLRELLARLGDRRPLVLHIDDLHWGDLESVQLLRHLLSPPDPPVLLLLVCYRTGERSTSRALRALFESEAAIDQRILIHQIDVNSLPPQEARQLASALISGERPRSDALSATIAEESGGSPHFLGALARHQQGGSYLPDGSLPEEAASLEEVLWAQISKLPDAARRLLEVVALAGRPLRQGDACKAAGLERRSREALGILRAAHMIRTTGEKLDDRIEVYDRRIRDAVLSHVSPEAGTD